MLGDDATLYVRTNFCIRPEIYVMSWFQRLCVRAVSRSVMDIMASRDYLGFTAEGKARCTPGKREEETIPAKTWEYRAIPRYTAVYRFRYGEGLCGRPGENPVNPLFHAFSPGLL